MTAAKQIRLSAEDFAEVVWKDLKVIVFHDKCEHLRWFMRDHSVIGAISAAMLDGEPVYLDDVLRIAREFGPDAYVLL